MVMLPERDAWDMRVAWNSSLKFGMMGDFQNLPRNGTGMR